MKKKPVIQIALCAIFFLLQGHSFAQKIDMVLVKGGTFTMGCTPEQSDCCKNNKTKTVTVKDFYIAKFEVTQALWKAVAGTKNYPYFPQGDNLPALSVSWYDTQAFIKKLNELTGKNYRLPTEAEWEFTARGGVNSKGYKYSGSNVLDDVSWYFGNAKKKENISNYRDFQPVGTKLPNELGIYDMTGNVWEWCSDEYGNYKEVRVLCGGGIYSNKECDLRVTARVFDVRDNGMGMSGSYGFRLACDAE